MEDFPLADTDSDVAAELLNSPPRIQNSKLTLSVRNVFDTSIMMMLNNADIILFVFMFYFSSVSVTSASRYNPNFTILLKSCCKYTK